MNIETLLALGQINERVPGDRLTEFFATFDAEAEAESQLQLQHYLNHPADFIELCREAFMFEDSCDLDTPVDNWAAYAVPVQVRSIRLEK